MINHRLVKKDYKRLRRKEKEELKKGISNPNQSERSQLTIMDELASIGRKKRDRVLRRWSTQSIRSGSTWKRDGNQGVKIVNGGKLERERGRNRKAERDEKNQSQTGIYTRVGVDLENEVSSFESLEKRFEKSLPPKRKGIGRKVGKDDGENGGFAQRKWLCPQDESDEEKSRKDRHGRRGNLKKARSLPRSKERRVEEKMNHFYSISRRTRMRMQRKRRSHVRVSRENVRSKLE